MATHRNNMRRVHVLIDASPCEREAGVLNTGASPNCEMGFTSRPGITFTVLVFILGSSFAVTPEGRISRSRGAFCWLQFGDTIQSKNGRTRSDLGVGRT